MMWDLSKGTNKEIISLSLKTKAIISRNFSKVKSFMLSITNCNMHGLNVINV